MAKRPTTTDLEINDDTKYHIKKKPRLGSNDPEIFSVPQDAFVHGILSEPSSNALARLLLGLTCRIFWEFYCKTYRDSEMPQFRHMGLLDSCTKSGFMSLIEFALSTGLRFSVDTSLDAAIESGEMIVLERVLASVKQNSRSFVSPLVICARCGNLEMAKYIHTETNWTRVDRDVLLRAVESGRTEFVDWVFRSDPHLDPFVIQNAMAAAASKGRIDLIRFIFFEGQSHNISTSVFEAAAETGQLLVLKGLVQYQKRIPFSVGSVAVEFGQIEILKYYLDHQLLVGYPLGGRAIEHQLLLEKSAQFGRIEALKILFEVGINAFDECSVVKVAIENFQRDTMLWLLDHKFNADAECFMAAVRNGPEWKEMAMILLARSIDDNAVGAGGIHSDDDYTIARRLLQILQSKGTDKGDTPEQYYNEIVSELTSMLGVWGRYGS